MKPNPKGPLSFYLLRLLFRASPFIVIIALLLALYHNC
jgi:hypothetical protein